MQKKSKDKVFFCSSASKYFHEMLAGTASTFKKFVLVEYGKPFPAKITQADLPAEWFRRLRLFARENKAKVLLVRSKSSSTSRRILFVDCTAHRYCTIEGNAEDIYATDIASVVASSQTQWQNKPFFSVCTNGKKDKCCSKFGFPVFKFFEGMSADAEIWECSHVGGDRFAANVIYFPYGIYYGRVTVEDIPQILDYAALGQIYLPNYRGLSSLSFYQQAVEYYMRKHLDNSYIDFPMQIKVMQEIENEITAQVTTGSGIYEVSVTRQVILYPHYLTCTSKTRENITKFMLNYIEKIAG